MPPVNPEAYIVGEIWDDAGRWLQGDQFDAVMNYLITAATLSFFGNGRLDMSIVNQAGGLQGRVHPHMDANWFANEIDRLTNLYSPEITRSQLNLLDRDDMPRFLTYVSNDVTFPANWRCSFCSPTRERPASIMGMRSV